MIPRGFAVEYLNDVKKSKKILLIIIACVSSVVVVLFIMGFFVIQKLKKKISLLREIQSGKFDEEFYLLFTKYF